MKKKIAPLTTASLSFLPKQCRYCNFWQSGSSITYLQKKPAPARTEKEKMPSGKLLFAGNQCVGYINYAPASFFPRLCSLPLSPGSLDTIFIACFYLQEGYRRQGLGRYFLQYVLRDLSKRGYKKVETIAKPYPQKSPAGWVEFYQACGFQPVRQINDLVLLRLDMRSIASWADKVGEVVSFMATKNVTVSHEIR